LNVFLPVKNKFATEVKKKIEEIKSLSQDLITDLRIKLVSIREEIETLFTNVFEIIKWGEEG
jgi:hypothetical protein